jgi:hypothetical protein
MLRSIDRTYNSKDGYLTDQLCIWNNVTRVDYDTNALHSFLIQKFNRRWQWLEKASISKTSDGNKIKVSHGLNSILITPNLNMEKATLSFRGRKFYDFILKEMPINQSENMLVIYTDEFRIPYDGRFMKIPLVQMHLKTFEIFFQSRIMKLIFSLSLIYRIRLPAIDILAHDQNFIKQLNMTKQHFDKWYSYFFGDQQ